MRRARAGFEQVVRRGIERGELPADVDVGLLHRRRPRRPSSTAASSRESPVAPADIEHRPRSRARRASARYPTEREAMAAARDAKEWAASGGLHGIGNSLYTPVQRHRRRRHRLRRVPRAGPVLRRRPRAPHALAHERDRRVVVADHRRAQAAARGRGRGGARDRTRHRDPGVHERHVGEGLRRAHPARRGARRRHLLPADAADGGPRRRGRAALLPVRRRPHRHRARPVQLGLVRLRAHARRRSRRSPTRFPRCAR